MISSMQPPSTTRVANHARLLVREQHCYHKAEVLCNTLQYATVEQSALATGGRNVVGGKVGVDQRMRLYADAPNAPSRATVGPTTSNRASNFLVGLLGQRTLLEDYVKRHLRAVKSFEDVIMCSSDASGLGSI